MILKKKEKISKEKIKRKKSKRKIKKKKKKINSEKNNLKKKSKSKINSIEENLISEKKINSEKNNLKKKSNSKKKYKTEKDIKKKINSIEENLISSKKINSYKKIKKISNYNLPSEKIFEDSISTEENNTIINNNIFDKENMILSPIQSYDNFDVINKNEKIEENFLDSFYEEFYDKIKSDFFYDKFLEENSEVEIRINFYKLSFDCENKFFLETDDLKKFKTINLKWEKKNIFENDKKKIIFNFEINGKELFNLNSGAHKKIRSPPIFLKTNKKLKILSILNLEDLSDFYVKLNIQLNTKNIKNKKHYKTKKNKIKKKLKIEIVKFFHQIFSLEILNLEKKKNIFYGKETKEYIKYNSKNKSEIQKKIITTILNKEEKQDLIESSNFIKNNLNLWGLKQNNNDLYNINLEEKFRKMKIDDILENKNLDDLIQFIVNEKKAYKKMVFDYKGNEPVYFIDYDSKKIIFKMKNGIYVDFEDSLKFVVFFTKKDKFFDYESQYYKLLAHFIQITKSIKTNIFVNFSKLNLVSLRNRH